MDLTGKPHSSLADNALEATSSALREQDAGKASARNRSGSQHGARCSSRYTNNRSLNNDGSRLSRSAVKADKAKALASFNAGTDGFKDRDLQPFCFNIADGKIVASTVPNRLGTDIRTLKDKSGKEFGLEGYQAAVEGKITETTPYMFPRPGTDPTLFERRASLLGSAISVAASAISSNGREEDDALRAAL